MLENQQATKVAEWSQSALLRFGVQSFSLECCEVAGAHSEIVVHKIVHEKEVIGCVFAVICVCVLCG